MATKIVGSTSGNIAEVDDSNQLKVAPAATVANSGYVAGASDVDAGTITGSRLVREFDPTPDFRLRVGTDNILMMEYFAGTNINTSIWGTPIATATTAQAGGFITLNNSASLTTQQGGVLRSHRTFPIYATFSTYFDILAQIPATSSPWNNAIAEFGAGLLGATVTTGVTDGAYFRITTTGIVCVVTNNAAEVSAVTIANATLNAVGIYVTNTNHYLVAITEDQAEFWCTVAGGTPYLLCKTARSSAGIQTTCSQQLGAFGRCFNTGTNTQNAFKLNIAMVAVSIADMAMDLPFSHRMSSAGNMACQVQTGAAAGKTCSWNNWTTLPAQTTAPSVSAAGTGMTTGLGGIQRFGNGASTLTLTADSSYIVFTYLVPALTVTVPIVPVKCLVLTGMKISACSRGAAGVATIYTLVYSLMVGGLGVNPATAESATTPAKTARPVVLGMHTCAASPAVGTMLSPDIQVMFDSPYTYNPGEYVQVCVTPMVTLVIPANSEIIFTCTPIGYWK